MKKLRKVNGELECSKHEMHDAAKLEEIRAWVSYTLGPKGPSKRESGDEANLIF